MLENQDRLLVGYALQAGGRRFESAIAHKYDSELKISLLAVFFSLFFVFLSALEWQKMSGNMGVFGCTWVHFVAKMLQAWLAVL